MRARHPERASLLSSFRFALEGIAEGLRTERNMVIHVGIMALVIVFGALLALSPLEWMLCVLLFGLVFMAELFNTAVETVVNMVTEDYHSRAKRAKDMAAGAVLVASVTAAVIGALIFIPKVLAVVRTGFHS
ncbi:MAG: diacylglycerol kinase family protein [Clostridia bacterium]|nr:diacylglycerol kinase family protein [Clostridia bacterium]